MLKISAAWCNRRSLEYLLRYRGATIGAAALILGGVSVASALKAHGPSTGLFENVVQPVQSQSSNDAPRESWSSTVSADRGTGDTLDSPVAALTIDSRIFEDVDLVELDPSKDIVRYFDGRPIRPVQTMAMTVTAYSPDARSCAPFADGITASGFSVFTNGGKLIAADKKFGFGTLMTVPGYNGGRPTPVLDRGGAIKGGKLDVLFPTHEEALQWGNRRVFVTLWDYAD